MADNEDRGLLIFNSWRSEDDNEIWFLLTNTPGFEPVDIENGVVQAWRARRVLRNYSRDEVYKLILECTQHCLDMLIGRVIYNKVTRGEL